MIQRAGGDFVRVSCGSTCAGDGNVGATSAKALKKVGDWRSEREREEEEERSLMGKFRSW